MKMRSDFVTNSSSSSFIVGFKDIPKTVEEMKQLLFGDQEFITKDNWRGGVINYPTIEIAEVVFNELMRSNPKKKDYLYRITDELYDYNEYSKEYDEEIATLKNNAITLYEFTYSDNDGDFWSMMEHSNIFGNLPGIRISHH